MELIIASMFSILFFLLLASIYRRIGLPLSGANVHPFSLSVIIQFCIFSLPGVIIISFLGYNSARYTGIDEVTRIVIGFWYFYSLFAYFFVFLIFVSIFKLKNYNRYITKSLAYNTHMVYATVLLFLSISCLLIKLLLSKKAPIFYLLQGDFSGAYVSRVDIQTNPQSYYIPYFSNVLSLLMIFQFYFIFYFYIFSDKITTKLRLYVLISFVIAAIECLYETQKAPIIFLMFGAIFILYLKKNKVMKILVPLGIIVFIVTLLQATVSGTDLSAGFDSAADRFLLGQNQGFYHIINSIKPDSKYWFTNFYFIERLGVSPSRADVDVIPYLNYISGLDIVNVNSYYLGEAWSMFGYYGLLLSPVVVGFAMFIFAKIIDILIGYSPSFFIPYAIYIIPELRINQSFTYFLYGKDFVFRTMLMFILFSIVIALSSLFLKKKENGFNNAQRN